LSSDGNLVLITPYTLLNFATEAIRVFSIINLKFMIKKSEIESTYKKIREDLFTTPLIRAEELSRISGAEVYLKMEHLQKTGSFKLRGILSKLNTINKEDFKKTFVTASTGNHAAAFAYASEAFGFKGVLFMPEKTSLAKIKAIEHYPVKKHFFGSSSVQTEAKAGSFAIETGGLFIHPYNDLDIIKGQATIGLEIERDLPESDAVLAPIGGGGLISGLCLYYMESGVDVIGCQPLNASEMYESVKAGKIVPPSKLETISDATAGGIDKKAISYNICKNYLGGFELIREEDIKKALAFVIKYHHTLIEPASALPVAALLNNRSYKGRKVVLVLTGRKINSDLLTNILNSYGDYY